VVFRTLHSCLRELIKIVDDDNQELGEPFISVSAPSIVSGMSGESEKTLRETFEEAKVRYTFCCRNAVH
jgi:SpoVK/Ycf46/Vps4 family AAA+-type ATPase